MRGVAKAWVRVVIYSMSCGQKSWYDSRERYHGIADWTGPEVFYTRKAYLLSSIFSSILIPFLIMNYVCYTAVVYEFFPTVPVYYIWLEF